MFAHRLAAAAAAFAIAGTAQAQTAFRGDCDQARTFASSVTFKNSYRGVQRITTGSDACGRDVIAAYNLRLRPGASADYDMVGRYYYLWPTNGGGCGEELYNRLSGSARITQQVKTSGMICEVSFILEMDVAVDEKYGPNKFSKLVSLIGADASRFAATLPTSTEAMIFYEAAASLENPAPPPGQSGLGGFVQPAPGPFQGPYPGGGWGERPWGYGRPGF